MTSSQVTRKLSPPVDGEEELTERLWEGPGLADGTSRDIKAGAGILRMSLWQLTMLPALPFFMI